MAILATNYIYFYHLLKYLVIPVYPEQLTDNMASSFKETNALSRSAPVFTYSNSGPRTVQITLNLHRDIMNDYNHKLVQDFSKSYMVDLLQQMTYNANKTDVVDLLVNYLQAAALPVYNAYNAAISGVVPPMVAVRFGDQLFVKGVVTGGVNVVYKKPIMSDSKYASVDVTFTVSEIEPYDAPTVASVGSFRGISAGNSMGGLNEAY